MVGSGKERAARHRLCSCAVSSFSNSRRHKSAEPLRFSQQLYPREKDTRVLSQQLGPKSQEGTRAACSVAQSHEPSLEVISQPRTRLPLLGWGQLSRITGPPSRRGPHRADAGHPQPQPDFSCGGMLRVAQSIMGVSPGPQHPAIITGPPKFCSPACALPGTTAHTELGSCSPVTHGHHRGGAPSPESS